MTKYRKKPVVIEAFQVAHGVSDAESMPVWAAEAYRAGKLKVHRHDRACFEIETLEGTIVANPGDWIIQGVKGELYPCKPDIFAATYEAA